MRKTKRRSSKDVYRAVFEDIARLLWCVTVLDAAYILHTVRQWRDGCAPDSEMWMPAAVPAMTEHILVAVILLLLCSIAAETVFREP